MNLNVRELSQHVEYEPDTYYAAFSAELEISASPLWSLINHCGAPASPQLLFTPLLLTYSVMYCLIELIIFVCGNVASASPQLLSTPLLLSYSVTYCLIEFIIFVCGNVTSASPQLLFTPLLLTLLLYYLLLNLAYNICLWYCHVCLCL